jgi:hypothetical protein
LFGPRGSSVVEGRREEQRQRRLGSAFPADERREGEWFAPRESTRPPWAFASVHGKGIDLFGGLSDVMELLLLHRTNSYKRRVYMTAFSIDKF